MLSLNDIAIQYVCCHYCGASFGQRCRTKSGQATTFPHADRTYAVQQAWRVGFSEGRRVGADDARRRDPAAEAHRVTALAHEVVRP